MVLNTVFEATDEEILKMYDKRHAVIFKASPSGLRSRRSELQKAGWITSNRKTKNKAGRSCQMWCLTPKAKAIMGVCPTLAGNPISYINK